MLHRFCLCCFANRPFAEHLVLVTLKKPLSVHLGSVDIAVTIEEAQKRAGCTKSQANHPRRRQKKNKGSGKAQRM